MNNVSLTPVEQILDAYRENPRDWLTIAIIVERTGLPESTVERILQSFPEKFEVESIFGGRVYGLSRQQRSRVSAEAKSA